MRASASPPSRTATTQDAAQEQQPERERAVRAAGQRGHREHAERHRHRAQADHFHRRGPAQILAQEQKLHRREADNQD
jgi:hypothetical protein